MQRGSQVARRLRVAPAHALAKVAADGLDKVDFHTRRLATAGVVRLKARLGIEGELVGGWKQGKTSDLSLRRRSTAGLGQRPRVDGGSLAPSGFAVPPAASGPAEGSGPRPPREP